MFLFVCALDTGVNEGEPLEEFAEQYREPEPEEPYREQELSEGFEDGKFNPILRCIFCPSFINTTYWPVLQIAYAFTAKTWLDSHPLTCYNHSLTT